MIALNTHRQEIRKGKALALIPSPALILRGLAGRGSAQRGTDVPSGQEQPARVLRDCGALLNRPGAVTRAGGAVAILRRYAYRVANRLKQLAGGRHARAVSAIYTGMSRQDLGTRAPEANEAPPKAIGERLSTHPRILGRIFDLPLNLERWTTRTRFTSGGCATK